MYITWYCRRPTNNMRVRFVRSVHLSEELYFYNIKIYVHFG